MATSTRVEEAERTRLIQLRSGTAWHLCLASGPAQLPLPDALLGESDAQQRLALYITDLCDGPFASTDESPDAAARREAAAWLDVLRCMDTWAQRASAAGISALGDVYESLSTDGEDLLKGWKKARTK